MRLTLRSSIEVIIDNDDFAGAEPHELFDRRDCRCRTRQ